MFPARPLRISDSVSSRCSGPGSPSRNVRSATATLLLRADAARQRVFEGSLRRPGTSRDAHVQFDVGVRFGPCRAGRPDDSPDRDIDRHVLKPVLHGASVGTRIDDANRRHPARVVREGIGQHHHAEFVGPGFDRCDGLQAETLALRLERGDVAHVQAGRSGVVLPDHDPIERAVARELRGRTDRHRGCARGCAGRRQARVHRCARAAAGLWRSRRASAAGRAGSRRLGSDRRSRRSPTDRASDRSREVRSVPAA